MKYLINFNVFIILYNILNIGYDDFLRYYNSNKDYIKVFLEKSVVGRFETHPSIVERKESLNVCKIEVSFDKDEFKYLADLIEEKFIKEQILPLDSRLEYRGIGLVWGIDFSKIPDSGFCDKVQEICFEHKLIIEAAGRNNAVIKTMPPLTISEETLLEGLEILKNAIEQALKTL